MSFRYPAGLITAGSPVAPQFPSGVWTNQQTLPYIKGQVWANDQYFQNTTLLLHGDGSGGTNNAQFSAFVDNSSNNFPITVNGDAYADNFSPFARDEGYWGSSYLGGNLSKVTLSSAPLPATGQFNFECWVNTNSLAAVQILYSQYSSSNSNRWAIGIDTNGKFYMSGNVLPILQTTTSITTGVWHHVAISRDSSNVGRIFLNGVLEATLSGWSATLQTDNPRISGFINPSELCVNGYLSNMRIMNTAYYTAGFTVPTSPLTAISGTTFLGLQDNRFIDNGPNNITLTNAGSSISPFTPFTVTPNTTDGSGYFDGSGDYLELSSGAAVSGTQAYTVECFVYLPSSFTGYRTIIGGGSAGSLLLSFNGLTELVLNPFGTGGIPISFTFTTSQWYHIAVCQSSGTTSIYINGTRVYNSAYNPSFTANAVTIGNAGAGNQQYAGFISNVRIVKGSAVYSGATITVPTTALTAVSGTSLLTCQYQGSVRNVGFIDSSPYDHRITRVGNTTQGSFSPFSKPDGGWGNYFDGTGDAFTLGQASSSGPLDLSTATFTAEAWVYINSLATEQDVIAQTAATVTGNSTVDWTLRLNTNRTVSFNTVSGSTQTLVTSTATINLNAWNHVAVVRSGTTGYVCVNGVVVSGTVSSTFNSNRYTVIGGLAVSSFNVNGYVSNLRVLKGTALYTSNFTPSTTPLTVVTNTSLLTCQSNRFIDNSSNNFTITRNGDVKVTPFSPFPITTAYDPAVNGGSGYFDGSGDYLTVADSATLEPSSSNFTIECWIYPTATGSFLGVFSKRTNNSTGYSPVQVLINGGQMTLYASTTGSSWAVSANASTNPPLNAWSHIAVARNGTASNNLVLYLNGVSVATGSVSNTALSDNAGAWAIGADSDDGGGNFAGYIAGFRSVIGSAVYTSAFTPPTAPPTAISNTVLLTNFTNAGVLDNTGFNNLETVGNAQIDTSVKKYGTGAMKFDGTGDYLVANYPSSDLTTYGTGDFTIEMWVRFNNAATSPSEQIFFDQRPGGGSQVAPMFYVLSSTIRYYVNGSDRITSGSVSSNTWYHLAVARSGTSTKMFIDGVQAGSTYTDTNSYISGASRPYIGISQAVGNAFSGYIDDLRITKGIARYTSNFTPPIARFPNQ